MTFVRRSIALHSYSFRLVTGRVKVGLTQLDPAQTPITCVKQTKSENILVITLGFLTLNFRLTNKTKVEKTAAIPKEKLLYLYSFYLPFSISEDESLIAIRW